MAIRVKYHPKSRTCTISGIDARYLSSIFTAASLHIYDGIREHETKEREERDRKIQQMPDLADVIEHNYITNGTWHKSMKQILDMLHTAYDAMLRRDYLSHVPQAPETYQQMKARRLAAVRESQKFNEIFELIIKENQNATGQSSVSGNV